MAEDLKVPKRVGPAEGSSFDVVDREVVGRAATNAATTVAGDDLLPPPLPPTRAFCHAATIGAGCDDYIGVIHVSEALRATLDVREPFRRRSG